MQWLVDHYRNAWPFDTVIIDELSSFKNPQAVSKEPVPGEEPHTPDLWADRYTGARYLLDLWSQYT